MLAVVTTKSKGEASRKAASQLNTLFDAHSHVPVLFLSSGGSSLLLLDHITSLPPKLTVGMTDERFSPDEKVNNFAQLAETLFFQKAQGKGAYFIDTRVQSGEDLEVLARRFEEALMTWREQNPGGRIVITQGVGPDGHTLGIMPYPNETETFNELFEGKRWVAGYDAEGKSEYPLRITVALPFLRQVDHSVVYMVGEEKKKALSAMLASQGTLRETPSRIVHEMKDVHVFTDIAD